MKRLLPRLVRSKRPAGKGEADGGRPARDRGLSVTRFGLALAPVVFAIIAAATWLAQDQLASVVAAQQAATAQAQNDRLVAALRSRIDGLAGVFTTLAGDPQLLAAVERHDAEGLAAFTRRVANTFPGALRSIIIHPDQRRPDRTLSPPVGYACLDLARQGEQGASPPPLELHGTGADRHLDLVRPIVGPGGVVASLVLTLDASLTLDWLREAARGLPGYAELTQAGGGQVRAVATIGDPALKSGSIVPVNVPGTRWQVSYWAPNVSVPAARQAAFFAIFGAAAVLLAAVWMGGILWLARLLRSDLVKWVDHMVEVAGNRRHHSVSMRLLEIQRAVRMMDETLPKAAPQRLAPGAVTAAKSVDDEIGDPLFGGSKGMTVEEGD